MAKTISNFHFDYLKTRLRYEASNGQPKFLWLPSDGDTLSPSRLHSQWQVRKIKNKKIKTNRQKDKKALVDHVGVINEVFSVDWLLFSIFSMLSMFSKLTPSAFQDGKILQFVEPWFYVS